MSIIRNTIKRIVPNSVKRRYADFKLQRLERMSRGKGVVCPVCGAEYKEFGPYGNFNRKNAYCFNCESLERHRLYWLYLNNEKKILAGNITMLHIAPERNLYERFSKLSNITYVPCDLRVERYDFPGGPKVLEVNVENMPFEDNTFDFVICSHVLEHVPDDNKAMSELFRVMKHGGSGIIQAPIDYSREFTYQDDNIIDPLKRLKAFGQDDHLRWYGRDYPSKLEAVGFLVTEDNYVNTFSPQDQFKYGLNSNELIYYCMKR